MPHGVFLFPLAQNKKCTKKFTAFLGISSRVETRGGNRLKKGGKFWTRPAICSFALDISTIGQQFQHFFVTLSAPVLHLSFAFHFAFVCRLEIYTKLLLQFSHSEVSSKLVEKALKAYLVINCEF